MNISAVVRRWGDNRGLLNVWRREAGLTSRRSADACAAGNVRAGDGGWRAYAVGTRIILSLDEENADFKARVAFLEGQLSGSKSEKMATVDPTQAMLDLGDLSDIPVAANDDVASVRGRTAPARRSPARNISHLPKHLARYDEVI